jgi:hypothetical protein
MKVEEMFMGNSYSAQPFFAMESGAQVLTVQVDQVTRKSVLALAGDTRISGHQETLLFRLIF